MSACDHYSDAFKTISKLGTCKIDFYQSYSKAFPYISLILRTHFFFPIKVFYLYLCTISVEPDKVLKVTVLMYFSRLFSQLGFSATQLRNFYPLGYFEPPNYMRKYTNYEFDNCFIAKFWLRRRYRAFFHYRL